jgi:hypothetical protein
VTLPSHFSAGRSAIGSMTRSVGQASIGYFAKNAALAGCSLSTSSQTNRPACFLSASSVKT